MNLKTKAVALLAGSALALSVASGALAETTSVTLNDNGDCTVGIANGDVSFGTYTWNAASNAYVKDGSSSAIITLEAMDNTHNQDGCTVGISGGDMDDDATSTHVIDVDYSHDGSVAADSVNVDVVAGTNEDVTASIPGTLATAYVTGGYSGTIVVTQGGGV